jgi:hypothetical protein
VKGKQQRPLQLAPTPALHFFSVQKEKKKKKLKESKARKYSTDST